MADRTEIAPGVTYTPCTWWDSYTGTDAAILAAGIVRPDQLPGAPGNGVSMVTFLPNGERPRKGDSRATRNVPGCMSVRRRTKRLLMVDITVSREVARARQDAWHRQREADEALARSWPFPVVNGRRLSAMPLDRQLVDQGAEVFA